MGKTDKARQQAYRQRMQGQGYRQFAFWLDENTQTALKLLRTYDASSPDLSSLVCEAIRHYHAYKLSQSVTSNTTEVTSNIKNVTSDNRKPVTSDTHKSVTRYMTQDLENHILDLRQSGLSLNEVSERLFSEGHRNAKGQPYSTGTLSKAETRAKARLSL